MKPILLQGHERSITQIKYNREGDLLFSVAKDTVTNVWYSVNGERLGTYNGHTGAVWCVDCDWDTKNVLTGSADNSCRLWDCETGKQLALLNTNSAVRTCGFDFSGNIIMFSTDKQMGYQCYLNFFDLRDPQQIDDNQPYLSVPCSDHKITSAVWGPLGEFVIAGHENGEINQFSAKSGEVLKKAKEHSRQINDIQPSVDLTIFISASKDNTAKLFDSTSLDHIKTFKTERPVNSAAISPIMDHVVMGGGQEAMEVTTTSTRIGKFEARYAKMWQFASLLNPTASTNITQSSLEEGITNSAFTTSSPHLSSFKFSCKGWVPVIEFNLFTSHRLLQNKGREVRRGL
uniref:Serine-threonine kinase receptor-associated protein n=1 Tax=Amphiprion ocellaris TaxID=80972 RepID=A0AAQ5YEB1_AMPOC